MKNLLMPERIHTHTCQNCRREHGHNDTMHGKHYCPQCARKCNCG